MTSQVKLHRGARLMVTLALTALMVYPTVSAAQSTSITSSGLGTALNGACLGGGTCDITGGSRRGANLFHSFGDFSVGAGDTSNFLNDTGFSISNIIGRVTAGNPSNIFGTISTRNFLSPNNALANLFMINPAGWIFGATAFLDVSGSFHASTADYVKLSDGTKFYADLTRTDSGMSSFPPAAFGFLGPPDKLGPPAPISVEGATLAVDPGQTLSLVGGDVTIRASDGLSPILFAPGGVVQIGSVASAGEAVLLTPDGAPAFDLGSFSKLGKVEISVPSGGDVGGISAGTDGSLPGGTVVIRSGQLIVDNAVIVNDTGDFAGASPVGIDLGATDSIVLKNGALVQTTSGAANASDIKIATTGKLTVTEATIESTAVDGRTGAIDIQVGSAEILNGVIRTSSVSNGAGDIAIRGASAGSFTLSGPTSVISTETFSSDPAILAGNVSLTDFGNVILTDQATIRNGGLLGQGGDSLTVTAGDSIVISGLAGISSQSFSANVGVIDISAPHVTLDGGFINTSTLGTGNAGRVLVTAGTVSLTNGAQIASSSQLSATGAGGSITINAPAGSVAITGVGPADGVGSITFTGDPRSGLFSTAQGIGDAGKIDVTTPTLTINNGGTISVATSGAGNAGNIKLDVMNFTQTGGATVDSSTISGGQGGDLTVTAVNSATISGTGSGLFSTASNSGNAGQINVTTPTLAMENGGTISVATSGAGNAGDISLNVTNFTQTGGARVDSSTTSGGQGGDLTVTAANSATISGAGSGLFSTASSTGNAGEIFVDTPTLTVANGGKISVATSGAGDAGSVTLIADNFSLTGGAQVVSNTDGAGDGGSVGVLAFDSVTISGTGTGPSGLFSTASSTGNAGEIFVDTPTLTMNNGGTLSVATVGDGAAGNILLNVSNLNLAGGAQISSSTDGAGAGGTVGVAASDLVSISGAGSGFFSTASNAGNAGQITVSAPGSTPVPTLTIADGGKISVATSGAGNAGSVSLNANTLNLTGGAQVVSSTDGTGQGGSVTITAANSTSIVGSSSGLLSTASSTGNAGQITLTTPTLTMGDSGTISVATSGAGNAGNASLNVTNFTQTGGAKVDSSTSGAGHGGNLTVTAASSATISDPGSGLSSTASGTGAGGNIALQAENIQLLSGGTITTNSTGSVTASAGDVNIVFGDTLRMVDSSITTAATLADGGNISITATGSMLQMTNSNVITSVASGFGTGGNITIGSTGHPFDFVVLNDSQIRADAFGGPGGNININADVYLTSNSLVSASSQLSSPGIIAIEASFTDVSGSIAQLPETPLKATDLLRASCAARFAGGKLSSLVLSGRDGLPIQPGGVLPSPLYLASNAAAPVAGIGSLTQGSTARFSLLSAGSRDRLLTQYSLLPNAKCAF